MSKAVEKIREYLKDNGISQRHIAKKIGMDQDKFNRSLNGRRQLTIDEYFLVCKALEKDPSFFMDYRK